MQACIRLFYGDYMEFIKLTAIGFLLGITAVIPGFSVATMAVVFKVYDRLIDVIVPNIKKIFASWLFWLPLAIGGIIGIIFFSKIFLRLVEYFDIYIYWVFIGVIAGSTPLIYTKTKKPSSIFPSVSSIICCVLAFAVMIFMTIIKPENGDILYTELTLPVFGLLAMAGALAAIAMIIPGISGAFMLLVIGFYSTILKSVSDMNIPLILPVILGALIGLLLSTAFVRFLFAKVPRQTYSAVLGLVAGSVLVLYKGFGTGMILEIAASIVSLLTGLVLSYVFSNLREPIRRRNFY